jgi:hypothetical protein
MIAHTAVKSNIEASVDPSDDRLYVYAVATTAYGQAVANANVAMLLTDPEGETVGLAYAKTDTKGRASAYLAIDTQKYPHGTPLDLTVLLSPASGAGPARTSLVITGW